MSSYDDDYSDDDSFSSSSISTSKDEAPTLDEAVYDLGLFNLFRSYMASQQSVGPLMFLKDARLFRALNQPHAFIVQYATRIVMNYFVAHAPFPVSVSDEERKKMVDIILNPDALLSINKDTFTVAFGEVYNAVIPHFRNWVSTGEWREAVPFHRIPPPSFHVVLTSNTLRLLFNKFLKMQLDHDTDGSAAHAYHLWKFCLIVTDFREGKYTQESHESKKKKKGDGEKPTENPEGEKPKEEEAKPVNPEEYAKHVYKKYKRQLSLPYDKTMPYAVFIVRALDQSIEEFDKSSIFSKWLGLKQYQGVDYQAKIVHQPLTPEGYAEPPTLAAIISSSILQAFLVLLQGTEQGLNLEFLSNILTFHQKYAQFEATEKSSEESSSSGVSRKDMIEEAQRIYSKFLDKSEMYCDASLVEEVRLLVTKSGGKGVNPAMFRKVGAFIYHRSEMTWCREARATFAWANKSYDNHSKSTRAVEEEFSMKNLPDDFDLQIVPCIDDIYNCPALLKDYSDFADAGLDGFFSVFTEAFIKFFRAPVHGRKAAIEKLLKTFDDGAAHLEKLGGAALANAKDLLSHDRVSEPVVYYLLAMCAHGCATHYYKRWIVEHSKVWKNTPWQPVPMTKFSDLKLLLGMSTVQTKIEEAALKGKSGFSRYLAKRQMKKSAMNTVRVTKSANTPRSEGSVFDILSGGKDMSDKEITIKFIPTIYQTLSSVYMRKVFEQFYLEVCLNSSEMALWEALSAFFKKYDSMENEDLIAAQGDMLKDIQELVEKYKVLIPKSEELLERAKKLKIIFPHFFRPVETELYGKLHSGYEEVLRKKGWTDPVS